MDNLKEVLNAQLVDLYSEFFKENFTCRAKNIIDIKKHR